MEQSKKELILFWVRHGERLDEELEREWKIEELRQLEFSFDSPLTERGK